MSSPRRLTRAQAARVAGVKPRTISQWTYRGLIQRFDDGYDLHELLTWLDTIRDTEKARGGILAAHSRHQSTRHDCVV